jgi:hypothetical protein
MFSGLIRKLRLGLRRRLYREGATISQFIAKDVRRDVEVLDASEVDSGVIVARVRTWNLLYAARKLVPKPELSEPRRVAIETLWDWNGPD